MDSKKKSGQPVSAKPAKSAKSAGSAKTGPRRTDKLQPKPKGK
jgi:hypothetical protein